MSFLKCQICDKPAPPHHIVFRSRGGSDTKENLVLLCMDCHRKVHGEKINLYGNADNSHVAYKINKQQSKGGTIEAPFLLKSCG